MGSIFIKDFDDYLLNLLARWDRYPDFELIKLLIGELRMAIRFILME